MCCWKQSCLSIMIALTVMLTACASTTLSPPTAAPTGSSPTETMAGETAVSPFATLELSPVEETEIMPATKETLEEEIMPVTPAPINPLVQFAKEDLADRLNVTPEAVELLKFESVVWPDGSLGCPQPGMAYTQVLVEGYRILLNYQGEVYSYHGGESREPFLCLQASAPGDILLPPPGFKE